MQPPPLPPQAMYGYIQPPPPPPAFSGYTQPSGSHITSIEPPPLEPLPPRKDDHRTRKARATDAQDIAVIEACTDPDVKERLIEILQANQRQRIKKNKASYQLYDPAREKRPPRPYEDKRLGLAKDISRLRTEWDQNLIARAGGKDTPAGKKIHQHLDNRLLAIQRKKHNRRAPQAGAEAEAEEVEPSLTAATQGAQVVDDRNEFPATSAGWNLGDDPGTPRLQPSGATPPYMSGNDNPYAAPTPQYSRHPTPYEFPGTPAGWNSGDNPGAPRPPPSVVGTPSMSDVFDYDLYGDPTPRATRQSTPYGFPLTPAGWSSAGPGAPRPPPSAVGTPSMSDVFDFNSYDDPDPDPDPDPTPRATRQSTPYLSARPAVDSQGYPTTPRGWTPFDPGAPRPPPPSEPSTPYLRDTTPDNPTYDPKYPYSSYGGGGGGGGGGGTPR
jgi:hypothetical protein